MCVADIASVWCKYDSVCVFQTEPLSGVSLTVPICVWLTEPLQVIEEPVAEVTVVQGGVAQLQCVARGFPYPWYTWFKEDKEVSPSSSSGVLHITNVQ